MLCRHTIAHWRRFVKSPEGATLFAACELLAEEGVQVEDWRTIACTYWGRQPECPFFQPMGQEKMAAPKAPPQPREPRRPAAEEIPVDLKRAALGFSRETSRRFSAREAVTLTSAVRLWGGTVAFALALLGLLFLLDGRLLVAFGIFAGASLFLLLGWFLGRIFRPLG